MGNTEAPLSSLSQQSSQMPILNSERKLRSKSVSLAGRKSSRTGDVVDTLVVLIAAVLLPAWLLGQLFLASNSASASVAGGGTDDTSASQPADPDGDSESSSDNEPKAGGRFGSGTDSGNMANSNGGSEEADGFQAKLQSMTAKFDSLSQSSATLEAEVTSLKQSNATLTQQNADLKAKANQHVMSFKKPNEDAEALKALQMKYDTTASELQSLQSSLQSTESEKRTLQMSLADAQSKLQEAEAKMNSGAGDTPFALLGSGEKKQQDDMVAAANEKAAAAGEEVVRLRQQIEDLNLSLTNSKTSMAMQEKKLQEAMLQARNSEAQNIELKTALDAAIAKPTAPAMPAKPKEEFRDFVSSKGSVSRMAFIRWEGEDVIVRSFANKKLYRLTMDRFSEEDKKYLLERK